MSAALAAQLAAHPKGPKPIRDDQPHPGWRDGVYRDDDGIYWLLTPAVVPGGTWLPDLADPATAGRLLAMLDEAGAFVEIHYGRDVEDHHVASVRVWPKSAPMIRGHKTFDGPTLGEALAHALLSCWSTS